MVTYINNNGRQVIAVPYPHMVLDDFFCLSRHTKICQYFEQLKARGIKEEFNPSYLSRFPGYDAYCWVLEPDVPDPLDVFYSRALRDHFSQIFNLSLSEEVVAEFHHHKVGSKGDCWHDDYNVAYFSPKESATAEMNPWYFQTNYMGGESNYKGQVLRQSRALTLIYYFGDFNWQEEDGGETDIGKMVEGELCSHTKVAPHANRLLAFPCSPLSYHRFLKNHRSIRNSIILWYHSDVESSTRRYGQAPRGWSEGDRLGGKRSEEGMPLDEVIYEQDSSHVN